MPDNETAPEFASILISHAKGRAHDKASELLAEAVDAVIRTGSAADVTVKLGLKLMPGTEGVVRIESKVTAKIPEEAVSSIWFADDHGGLHRSDPNQASLFDNDARDGKTAAAGHDN